MLSTKKKKETNFYTFICICCFGFENYCIFFVARDSAVKMTEGNDQIKGGKSQSMKQGSQIDHFQDVC